MAGIELRQRAESFQEVLAQIAAEIGRVVGVHGDRKSGVEGKSVSVRVDLGGRRIIKKKTSKQKRQHQTRESVRQPRRQRGEKRNTHRYNARIRKQITKK